MLELNDIEFAVVLRSRSLDTKLMVDDSFIHMTRLSRFFIIEYCGRHPSLIKAVYEINLQNKTIFLKC